VNLKANYKYKYIST